jgi:hypothetical protein
MAEFDALFAEAVQGVARPERARLRLDLVFNPDNAARAADTPTCASTPEASRTGPRPG